jgi:hypothetical protein
MGDRLNPELVKAAARLAYPRLEWRITIHDEIFRTRSLKRLLMRGRKNDFAI